MSSTVSGVPPHLVALSQPDKPHPCGWMLRQNVGKARGGILDSWGPGVGDGGVGRLLGKEERSWQGRNRAQGVAVRD